MLELSARASECYNLGTGCRLPRGRDQTMTPNPTSYKSVPDALVAAVFCLMCVVTMFIVPACGPESRSSPDTPR